MNIQGYVDQFIKTLPKGPLWVSFGDNFMKLIIGIVTEFHRIHIRAEEIILELRAKTATELLEDYEEEYLHDSEKPSGGETLAQRRQVVFAKQTARGASPSRSFFENLAAKLGMTVIVTDLLSVEDANVARVDEALIDEATVSETVDAFRWNIEVVSDPDAQLVKLQAIVDKLKHAHTVVSYT
jgi:uncharacterized protein YmfQ (DUF2313 family)